VKPRHRRFAWIGVGLLALCAALALGLHAFNSKLVFVVTPTQIIAREAPLERAFRIGGMVEEHSLKRADTRVQFVVTDKANRVTVEYVGILPDLFKEGKGVVAQGRLGADGLFRADQVLAKHDENYMPPEAAAAMKKGAEVAEGLSRSLVEPGAAGAPR
jgi:cytochrome c-type biogenesis protein CcmE